MSNVAEEEEGKSVYMLNFGIRFFFIGSLLQSIDNSKFEFFPLFFGFWFFSWEAFCTQIFACFDPVLEK